MATQYFEFRSSSSSKFWEVTVQGKTMTVRYGRIGTSGQSKEKELDSPAAAKKEAAKLIAAKEKKGYAAAKAGNKAAAKTVAKKKAAPKKKKSAAKTKTAAKKKAAPKKKSAAKKKTAAKKKSAAKKKPAWPLNTVSMSSVKALMPKGRSLPPLLAAFGKWVKRVPHGALGYFEGVMGEGFIDSGLAEEAVAAIDAALTSFLVLGEGSQVALWYYGKGEPAVVLVDSEGQHENLAPSLERFLLNWSKRKSDVFDLDGEEDEDDEGPPLAYERLGEWLKKEGVRASSRKTPSFEKWMTATIKTNTPKAGKPKKMKKTKPTAKTTAKLIECVGLLAVESPLAELLEELGIDLTGRRSERDFRSVHVAEHGYALSFEWPKGATSPHGDYKKGAKAALAKKSKSRMLINVEFCDAGYESWNYYKNEETTFERYPASLPDGIKWNIRPKAAKKKGYKPIYDIAPVFSVLKNGIHTSLTFVDDDDYDEDEDPKNKGPNFGALEYVSVSCPYKLD